MQRLSCERYPCHFPQQDCAFCYCPFYPCHDGRIGGRMEGGEWSCRDCILVHRIDVAEMMMDALLSGEEIRVVWGRVERVL
jgi:threonine-phosphate decarboxylase